MYVWDVKTQNRLLFEPGFLEVSKVVWSSDGRYLAIGTEANVKIFDVDAGHSVYTSSSYDWNDYVLTSWLLPNDRLMKPENWFYGEGKGEEIWSTPNSEKILAYFKRLEETFLSLSPDREHIAFTDRGGRLIVLAILPNKYYTFIHRYRSFSWSPDGHQIAAVRINNTIDILQVVDYEAERLHNTSLDAIRSGDNFLSLREALLKAQQFHDIHEWETGEMESITRFGGEPRNRLPSSIGIDGPYGAGFLYAYEGIGWDRYGKGHIYTMNKETLSIGRDEQANICMKDESMSRLHASIHYVNCIEQRE